MTPKYAKVSKNIFTHPRSHTDSIQTPHKSQTCVTSHITCQLHNRVWEMCQKMLLNTFFHLTWTAPGLHLDCTWSAWQSRHLDCTWPGLYLECWVVTWMLPGVYQDTWLSVKYCWITTITAVHINIKINPLN